MRVRNFLYLIQLRQEDEEGEAINIDSFDTVEEALRAWNQDKDYNSLQVREDSLKNFDSEFYSAEEFELLPKKVQKMLKLFTR